MPKVQRFFLELKKNKKLNQSIISPKNVKVFLDTEKDININKFFYKQVGKDHFWRDRLLWSDKEWSKYINNKSLVTGVMKIDNELIGFYEQEYHETKNEIELIQMGILKEYHSSILPNCFSLAFNADSIFESGSLLVYINIAFSNILSKKSIL